MVSHREKPTVLLDLDPSDETVRGIMDACESLGWRVINVRNTAYCIPEGLIRVGAITGGKKGPRGDQWLQHLDIPIVSIAPEPSSFLQNQPVIRPDLREAGHVAASMFVERGFKDVGYVHYADADQPTIALHAGFQEGAEEHDCGFHSLELGTYKGLDHATTNQKVMEAIADWLRELPLPIGILAHNGRMGGRILCACEDAGLAVPEQVAVLCKGDVPSVCETAAIPLSAIDLDPEHQGRAAVRLLCRLSNGEPAPDGPVYVEPKGIVERRSTDVCAVSDPRVARAIRFIWDNVDCPITTDDVAAEGNMSRATLERTFRKYVGRGVNAELQRKRVERMKELVTNTEMTAAEISKAVGYSDKRSFHRVFKRAFGMTPGEYRKAYQGQEKLQVV